LKLEKNDYSHKMSIVYKTEDNFSNTYYGVASNNKYAYITTGWRGELFTYSLDNPLEPQKVSELKPPVGDLYQIVVEGNRGYITTTKSVVVINITNPSQPEFLEEIKIPDGENVSIYNRIVYKNNNFYICTGYSGLWILKNKV